MAYNDPYLTSGTRAILDSLGYGPGDTLFVQKLWNELSPTLRGDGFERARRHRRCSPAHDAEGASRERRRQQRRSRSRSRNHTRH